MKVLTIQFKNQRQGVGGSYTKYIELIESFLMRGWEVHHFSPAGFANVHHELLFHHGVRDTNVGPAFIPFSIQALLHFLGLRRRTSIDAVVAFSFLEGLLGVFFKTLDRRIKLVVAVHGDQIAGLVIDRSRISSYLYGIFLKQIERVVLNLSDTIIFVSDYNRRTITARAGLSDLKKTRVLYNNISNRAITLSSEPAILCRPERRTIGYAGSLYARGKGLVFLLDAFTIIKRQVPDTQLVLVGDGPDRDELVSLTQELGLTDDVIFTGFKDNPVSYMKGFDIFVLPSLHEACSLVLLEALCLNIPVLGSKVGGTPEVLGYEELLFEASDAGAIASRVLHLLQDPAAYREAIRLCNVRRQCFEFDWDEEMARAVLDVVGETGKNGSVHAGATQQPTEL